MDKALSYYCTGCGLCQAIGKSKLQVDKKGYKHPEGGDVNWLKRVCPVYGKQTIIMDKYDIWGRNVGVYYGWAKDEAIRTAASSGGFTTAVCCYLLEEAKVDGIIHTCNKEGTPTETMTCISTSVEELIKRSGSRYAISSPLDMIGELDPKNRYAFVGKPCDVDALRNFMQIDQKYKDIIPYVLSFFCMGLPSNDAQVKLLEKMECGFENCISLRYRGDGWPGYTKAIDKNGKEYKIDYDSSWGQILGRDLMPMCRFCINGIGETADISSGDAWYLGKDNKPVFSEAKGRNVVFARTELGRALIENAEKAGYLHIEPYDNYRSLLPHIQYAQYERRNTMISRIFALKVLFKPSPHYNRSVLWEFGRKSSFKNKWKFFKGTLIRALKVKY